MGYLGGLRGMGSGGLEDLGSKSRGCVATTCYHVTDYATSVIL